MVSQACLLTQSEYIVDIQKFLVLVWWVVDARKWFKGPKVNLEHLMHGREDQAAEIAAEDAVVVEGKGDDHSSDSDRGVPGEMPAGKQVGDMKPHGL